MKKNAAWIIFFLLILPTAAWANYAVTLSNGRQMVVENYWEEDGQIVFQYSGGTVRLPKSLILSIEDTEKATVKPVVKKPEPPPATEPTPAATEGQPAPGAPPGATPPVPGQPGAPAAPQQPAPGAVVVENQIMPKPPEDDPFVMRFKELELEFEDRFMMSKEELIDLSKRMKYLENDIIKARMSMFYREMFIKIFNMNDELEELVKEFDEN